MFDELAKLFRRSEPASEQRAIRNHQRTGGDPPLTSTAMIAATEAMAGQDAIPFGHLPSGQLVALRSDLERSSGALIGGATGTGKSSLAGHLINERIGRAIARIAHDAPLGMELKLWDPKRELFDLVARYLAAFFLTSSTRVQEILPKLIKVDSLSGTGRVTPFAAFRNAHPDRVSDAFVAFSRAEVALRVSGNFTEQTLSVLRMYFWLLTDLRFPENSRFAMRFFTDAVYRTRIISRARSTELREGITNAFAIASPASIEAAGRRASAAVFPEIALGSGIPYEDIEKLRIVADAPITLGNYLSDSIPKDVRMERAAWRLADALREAGSRASADPLTLVADEALTILDACPSLEESVAEGVRVFRSARSQLILIAQEFSTTLSARLLSTLTSNCGWMAGFQTQADAGMYFPHAPLRPRVSHGEQQRTFAREMANLPQRHYKLRVRGFPLLSVEAPLLRQPSEIAGVSDEELRTVFDREIASYSTVSASDARRMIDAWEAREIDGIVPNVSPEAPKRARRPKKAPAAGKATLQSLADVMEHLGSETKDGS